LGVLGLTITQNKNNTVSKQENRVLTICLCGLFAALSFLLSFAGVRLPLPGSGGYFHFGNVPVVCAAVIFGKKHAAVCGAVGMALFDILGGWLLWAPFTFAIRLIAGLLSGTVAQMRAGRNYLLNQAACLCGGAVIVVGYYFTEVVIYGNWLSPFASIPGNLMQIASMVVIGVPLAMGLHKGLSFVKRK
jgi:uncharacterized membrane protein